MKRQGKVEVEVKVKQGGLGGLNLNLSLCWKGLISLRRLSGDSLDPMCADSEL